MENGLSMGDQFLAIVNRIIEENLTDENFSVEDLAQHAGLSRSMLHRKLIKLSGKSATDLIMEKRLTRAKELLDNDAGTVSEIAYKVGFNSVSYFHRVFKKRFGVPPGDIKKDAAAGLYRQPDEKSQEIQIPKKSNLLRLRMPALITLLVIIIAGIGIYFYISGEKKTQEKSIAILPFDNLSPDEENRYFADGIVEDLLFRISQIEELKVISRTSSEMFRDKGNKTVPEIAKILGVQYILEGSIQRRADNIRISIQLIDAHKDDRIFSKQYYRNINEVFKIQGEVANQIASELSLVLTDKQLNKLTQSNTENLKAFEYYQLGRFHSSKLSNEGYSKGIEYYEKAIEEDPNYALAYAGIATIYLYNPDWGNIMTMTEGEKKGIEFARKALELDPDLAEAHTALGHLYILKWNWERAEKELIMAIKQNPSYSTAHFFYAMLLMYTNRPDKAREQIDKAIELDPLSFHIRHKSSEFYYHQGKFREALEENRVSLELIKDHWSARSLAFLIFYRLGMEEEAVEAEKLSGGLCDCYDSAQVDSAYAKEGLVGLVWLRIKKKPADDATKAIWYAMAGEYDIAIDLLEKAYSEGKLKMSEPYNITFRELHDNPRFIAIYKNMGLQPYYPWIK
ncbi:MAG: helix-turn-helix domain-containing protein [Bacteroidales bacterium]|nr:helix-turn-helix domain-containing protein [Bacteroidales bacterium]